MNNLEPPAPIFLRRPRETQSQAEQEELEWLYAITQLLSQRLRGSRFFPPRIPLISKPNDLPYLPVSNPPDMRHAMSERTLEIPAARNGSQRDAAQEVADNRDNARNRKEPDKFKPYFNPFLDLQEKTRNDLNSKESEHRDRVALIQDILKPILGGDDSESTSILLCWGKRDHCQILPVKIPLSAGTVTTWELIQQAWYEHRGRQRNKIPCFGVREVIIVDISIADGSPKHLSKNTFIGSYTKVDTAARERDLEESIKSLKAAVSKHASQDLDCRYVSHTDTMQFSFDCLTQFDEDSECPVSLLHSAKKELSRLRLPQFLTLAFASPGVAAANKLIDDSLIYSEQEILEEIQRHHCPELRELKFRGLLIEEGWDLPPQHILLPLLTTVLFLIVIGSRFLYGEWSTAWTAGAFFVGLLALSGQRLSNAAH